MQAQNYVDRISTVDSITLVAYRAKLSQYVNPIPDSAFFYGRKIKEFATQLNYGKGIADSDYFLGACFKRIQENDSAIHSFKKSLILSEILNYDLGKGRAHNNLGRTYYLLGKMDSSILESKKAIASIKENSPTAVMIIADSHTALATAYSRKNEMTNAITHLLKVDSIHQKSSLRPDIIAAAYQNLGNIYLELKEYPSAVEQFNKANNQFEQLPENASQFYKNTTNVYLGNTYLQMDQLVEAEKLLKSSYEYFKKVEDQRLVAEIANYLGQVALKNNNSFEAEVFFDKSYKTHKNNNNPLEASQAALEIAQLELSKNNPDKALFYITEAENLNITTENTKLKQELFLIKAQALSQKGNYKQAYLYTSKARKLRDSLQKIQSAEKIKEIQAIYETESKDREIALLTSQKEVTAQKQQNQRNLLIVGISLSTIAGIFFFFQYRNRQKTTQKLQELDKAKSTFFANISHEFRTPLTLIKGPIENMLETASISVSQRNALNIARTNTNRMTLLVEQLLALSKLESNQFNLRVSENSFTTFLKAQVAAFEYAFSEKEINTVITIKDDPQTHWFDHDAMEKVLFNLLGNAAKYTPEKETIFIEGSTQKNNYVFTITNTGTTITDQEARHIFTRFYQTSTFNTGTGIGLALSKELITLHQGTLTLCNKTNKTAFSFSIPIHKNAYTTEEIAAVPFEQEGELLEIERISELVIDVQKSKNLPQLLIVDDNAEIRHYLQNILQENYHITLAANGQEGIEKAIQNIPDIIISDIMMPTMDGFEMVQLLKENELTAHVPILFVTAKTDDDSKLKGLAQGADQYITKPFNNKIVKASLQNILSTRKKLQDRFSQEVILRPKEIAVNSAEERFLEKLQKVFDENITNPEFNTTRFSELMDISRMQLHRKIEGLTGRSTSEFIRLQRIKLAASLLKENDITISEVAYSVGFNDPSYFAKCFKIEMGISPTKYSNK